MTSSFAALAALAVSGVGIGCSGDGDRAGSQDIPGLVRAARPTERPIDLDRAATDVAELVRATHLSQATIGERLGPHHLEVETTLEVREGDAVVDSLTDAAKIDLGAAGDYHAWLENSKEYGRDVYFVAAALYLRPRFGKFHRRAPTDEAEPVRIRDEIAGALGAYLELCAPGAVASDAGARQVAGRPARVIQLVAGSGPAPRDLPEHQAWRASAVIRDVRGEIALDVASGAPLAAELAGTVEFQRDGRHFTMKLSVRHAVSAIGVAAAIVAPPAEQFVDRTAVPTELEERESLLEGIAPPSDRARTPDNPTGSAAAAAER